jgi:hypothetical protein
MVLSALAAGAEALDQTGKAISAIEKIMPWILIQPPAAAAELAGIIKEVMKAPDVVNHAVDALLTVIDDGNPQLSTLGRLGSGSLITDVESRDWQDF